jgi:hypothetical protein
LKKGAGGSINTGLSAIVPFSLAATPSQIYFLDLRILEQRCRFALGDDFAVFDDIAALDEFEG